MAHANSARKRGRGTVNSFDPKSSKQNAVRLLERSPVQLPKLPSQKSVQVAVEFSTYVSLISST